MGYERGELSTDLLLIFIGAEEMPSISFSISERSVHEVLLCQMVVSVTCQSLCCVFDMN